MKAIGMLRVMLRMGGGRDGEECKCHSNHKKRGDSVN